MHHFEIETRHAGVAQALEHRVWATNDAGNCVLPVGALGDLTHFNALTSSAEKAEWEERANQVCAWLNGAT